MLSACFCNSSICGIATLILLGSVSVLPAVEVPDAGNSEPLSASESAASAASNRNLQPEVLTDLPVFPIDRPDFRQTSDTNAESGLVPVPDELPDSRRLPEIPACTEMRALTRECLPFHYITLSCDELFAGTHQFLGVHWLPALVRSSAETAEADPDRLKGASESSVSYDPAASPQMNQSQQTPSGSLRPWDRPASGIQLGDAIDVRDDQGVRLAIPLSAVESTGDVSAVETHWVPLPWNRVHPERNSYRFRHQPLYFEDPAMERCGVSHGVLTEVTSAIRFGGRIPLLPYLTASTPPSQCLDALPDCDCRGRFGVDSYLPPPTVKAVAAQAVATVGFIYVIP